MGVERIDALLDALLTGSREDAHKALGRLIESEHQRDEARSQLATAREEVERLRKRTHEIQAAEMEKRAGMEAELARLNGLLHRGREFTKDWTAPWTKPEHDQGWWRMTSENARASIIALVARADRLEAALRKIADCEVVTKPLGKSEDGHQYVTTMHPYEIAREALIEHGPDDGESDGS